MLSSNFIVSMIILHHFLADATLLFLVIVVVASTGILTAGATVRCAAVTASSRCVAVFNIAMRRAVVLYLSIGAAFTGIIVAGGSAVLVRIVAVLLIAVAILVFILSHVADNAISVVGVVTRVQVGAICMSVPVC